MAQEKIIQKWGFGMAPISSGMRQRYDNAVQNVLDFLYQNIDYTDVIPENISELKGMFNRCVKEDQWDWFSVHTEFNYPSKRDMKSIVNDLKTLRECILSQEIAELEAILCRLVKSGIMNCLLSYQDGNLDHVDNKESGWVYILSTRENPTILKIGMTTRSVSQRVKEINSATGVLYPLSARAVYRVKDAQNAETSIFKELEEFRIRKDREFFEIRFGIAVEKIKNYIIQEELNLRLTGELVWYNDKKKFGFISDGTEEDVFLHRSQLYFNEINMMSPGVQVEYSLLHRPQGKLAIEARLITHCNNKI